MFIFLKIFSTLFEKKNLFFELYRLFCGSLTRKSTTCGVYHGLENSTRTYRHEYAITQRNYA